MNWNPITNSYLHYLRLFSSWCWFLGKFSEYRHFRVLDLLSPQLHQGIVRAYMILPKHHQHRYMCSHIPPLFSNCGMLLSTRHYLHNISWTSSHSSIYFLSVISSHCQESIFHTILLWCLHIFQLYLVRIRNSPEPQYNTFLVAWHLNKCSLCLLLELPVRSKQLIKNIFLRFRVRLYSNKKYDLGIFIWISSCDKVCFPIRIHLHIEDGVILNLLRYRRDLRDII